jgi:hypothetical protein
MLRRLRHVALPVAISALLTARAARAEQPASTDGTVVETETVTPPVAAATPPAPGTAEMPAAPVVASQLDLPPAPDTSPVALKLYGDTLFQARNHGAVKTTFAVAHLDLFFTADVGKLSLLSEVFFEGREDNTIALDVERLQVSYLFENWLRVRAGRSHTAFGYYNDTYHHGNLFELTTERPFGVGFEDQGGLFTAHLVGAGADGTFELGKAGSLRYDAEIGNGRLADTTAVAVVQAGKTEKMGNVRLRWLTPVDGLAIGVNGVYDLVPEAEATATAPARPKIIEGIAGAHTYYMEHNVHFLAEGFVIHHEASAGSATNTVGAFTELGYTIGQFTPYVRPEYIHFPKGGDPIFQAPGAFWEGSSSVFDLRVGVRWLPLPQLALKLEGERLARGAGAQEIITTKIAFGF